MAEPCKHDAPHPKWVPSGGLFWWCDACGEYTGHGELCRTGSAVWVRDGWHGMDRIPVVFLEALPGGRAAVVAVRIRGAKREARTIHVRLTSLRPPLSSDRLPPELDDFVVGWVRDEARARQARG